MLQVIRKNKTVQLGIGLLIGILFGFLLQRGGVAEYDVILGQLLLTDFTVLKIMLTAAVVGMVHHVAVLAQALGDVFGSLPVVFDEKDLHASFRFLQAPYGPSGPSGQRFPTIQTFNAAAMRSPWAGTHIPSAKAPTGGCSDD